MDTFRLANIDVDIVIRCVTDEQGERGLQFAVTGMTMKTVGSRRYTRKQTRVSDNVRKAEADNRLEQRDSSR